MIAAASVIHVPHIRYLAIMPEVVMLVGAVLVLGVSSLFRRPMKVAAATASAVVVSATALGFAIWQWVDVSSHGPFVAVDKAVAVDGFSVLVQILVPSAMLLSALVGDGYLRREGVEGPEFHVLALVSASGAMLMGAGDDLIVIFLGLEILSIALYVLAAFNHKRVESGEAALKYFILGGFSSAVFVYGIALVYGATGSTNLGQIAAFLSHNVVTSDGLLLAGLTLLLVGFAFKISAVPFHMWTPDVYQGAPSPVTGFMAAVAKVGAFAALLRVFVSSFGVLQSDWRPVVYVLALVTLVLGAGLAVVQRDVKRMLAYSSINHAGFILLGLQAASTQTNAGRGVSAAMYYLVAYTFMVVGTFAVVTVLGRPGDGAHDITTYRGLSRRQPLLALCLAILLLAQAGAPFTTGLWAKLQVVLAAVDAHSVPLAAVAMASAAVAAFFYLRLAVLMYTPAPAVGAAPGVEDEAEDPLPLPSGGVGPAVFAGSTGPDAPPVGDFAPEHTSVPVWAGAETSVAVVEKMNAALLLDVDAGDPGVTDGPSLVARPVAAGARSGAIEATSAESPDPGRVPVPLLSAVAIGVCVGVTVFFGIVPGPLLDLVHKATLLFTP